MSSAHFFLRFLKKKRLRKARKAQSPVSCHDVDNTIEKPQIKCRLCMKEANIPIFYETSLFNIPESIRTFAGVEINEDDQYSQFICTSCHDFLQSAVLFRKTAQETKKLLHQVVTEECDTFDDFRGETTDIDYETASKSYSCKLCKLHFQSWDELIAHNNSKAHKSVRIQCPICHGLLTAQLYKKHIARHQSATHLICDICGKLYRKDNLVRHLQLHSYELPFQCPTCPYRGRFLESLKIHMRTHTGDKPFSCDKCELRFLTRSNLNRHLLTHIKERPFKCVECGRGFYTKRDKDTHFKADHAGVKDFSCRLCGNKYGTRKALMRHELRVHKRDKMAKGRVPLYLQAEYQKHE